VAQYAPDQVDTDEKKKDGFMIGLSTKQQECMALNTGGTFSEFVNNVIITDDAICAHKETKVLDGVPSWLHLPTSPATAASTLAPPAAVGSPTHLSAHTSRQHLRFYPHLRLCHACQCHRPLEPSPATPASTVVAQATSLESAPHQRRLPLRATSPIHHMVQRR
jgi:hypothetical protein